jgi:hypothetical protein
MTKQFKRIIPALILLIAGLSSCVNLKHVNNFASSSLVSVGKFEEINYSFTQNCLENCHHTKIAELDLNPNDCNCESNEKADSVTLLIYHSVRGYLHGLTSLSNNDLTSYQMDALTKALTESDLGSIKIESEQVEAYSEISQILLKSVTDGFRKKRIKEYVREANEPVKVLIGFLDFNLSSNLAGKLNVQKQRLESYYFDLSRDPDLSAFEKRKVVEEYYLKLNQIEARQDELVAYSKALRKIAEGHQKLVDNIDDLTNDEIKILLNQYSADIQGLISEFNKLKN